MYVCMYVCTYVCMHVCMDVGTNTKTHKKCNTNKSNSTNFKAKQIAGKLKIDDRVHVYKS